MSVVTADQSACDVAAEHTGAMVALYPAMSVAKRLIVDGGEPASELHVTLIYLGKADSFDATQIMMIKAGIFHVTNQWNQGYLAGKIGGEITFPSGPDGTPYCAHVDVPNLTKLREQLVHVMEQADISMPSKHGFTPHMTLKYMNNNDSKPPMPPSIPLIFSNVSLVLGTYRTDYPLTITSTPSEHLMARRIMHHPMSGTFVSTGS